MNVAIPLEKFDANNIYFAEKKRNVVIDGDFIKIGYSNSNIEMNELYISCGFTFPAATPARLKKPSLLTEMRNFDSNQFSVDDQNDGFVLLKRSGGMKKLPKLSDVWAPSLNDADAISIQNSLIISQLCAAETNVLSQYINLNAPNKKAVHNLRMQFANGVNLPCLYNLESGHNQDNTPLIDEKMALFPTSDIATHLAACVSDKRRPLGKSNGYGSPCSYILKISGLWETETNVGMTLKFICAKTR